MTRLYDIFDSHIDFSRDEADQVERFFKQVDNDARTMANLAGSGGQGRYITAGNIEIGWEDGLTQYNPVTGARTVYLDPDGDAWFGKDIDVPADTSLSIFSNNQTYNTEAMGEGDVLLGDNSTDKANLLWDRSAGKLYFRSGQTVSGEIGDGGLIFDWGEIGGWKITEDTIEEKLNQDIVMSASGTIKVGSGSNFIYIDGPNDRIGTANYVSGASGWRIKEDGDAEFNSITARGAIRASVFSINEISATAGTSGVWKSASTVFEDFYPPNTGNNFQIKIANADGAPSTAPFDDYDVIRCKTWNGTELVDFWGTLTSHTVYVEYTEYWCHSQSGGDPSAPWEILVPKGTAIIDYGLENGFIMQTADGSFGESANISVADFVAGALTEIGWGTGGGGYTVGDILTVVEAGASGGTIEVLLVGGSGDVLEVGGFDTTPVTGGKGYGLASGERTVTGGTGTGARVSVVSVSGPWDTLYVKARLGNLSGAYGAGANDYYGLGVGDYTSGNYISYNADGNDKFVISAGDGGVTLDEDGVWIKGSDGYDPPSAVNFWFDTQGPAYRIGYFAVAEEAIGGDHIAEIAVTKPLAGRKSQLSVYVDGATDEQGSITLMTNQQGDHTTYIGVYSIPDNPAGTESLITLGADLTEVNNFMHVKDALGIGMAPPSDAVDQLFLDNGTQNYGMISSKGANVYVSANMYWDGSIWKTLSAGKAGYVRQGSPSSVPFALYHSDTSHSAGDTVSVTTLMLVNTVGTVNLAGGLVIGHVGGASDPDGIRFYHGTNLRGDVEVQDSNYLRFNAHATTSPAYCSQYFYAGQGLRSSGSAGTPTGGDVCYVSSNSNSLEPRRNSANYRAYAYKQLTTPLTAGAWEARTGNFGPSVIDMSAVFGAPAGMRSVAVRLILKTSATHPITDTYFGVGPSSTYPNEVAIYGHGSSMNQGGWGLASCDSNGDVVGRVSGTATITTYLRVWGYTI